MNGAVSIVVIADRAVEHVIAQNAVKGLHLGRRSPGGLGGDRHPVGGFGCASADELFAGFNHAGVTRLNRAELGMIANGRKKGAGPVD
jgi:hypothetical protein